MYKNTRDVMTGLCRRFPKFTGEAVTVALDNGIAVSITGANRPMAGKMTVSVVSGGGSIESIGYLFDTGEVVRIAESLCRKYSTDQPEKGLIFTEETAWEALITVGSANDLPVEATADKYIYDDPDDCMAA